MTWPTTGFCVTLGTADPSAQRTDPSETQHSRERALAFGKTPFLRLCRVFVLYDGDNAALHPQLL